MANIFHVDRQADVMTLGQSTTTITCNPLTASRLMASDGSKIISSSDLVNWVAGTTNQITVTDDTDGTITLSTPQNIHAGASPTFAGLSLTGTLTTGALVGTPDEIIATSEGVAASITTVNTEVTTNGDSDLDNVTLANGTSGQIKHIYCVAEGNAADTWKITPATMLGGTQITFAGVGEGCTLVYADNEGWIVIGNNGGTIS